MLQNNGYVIHFPEIDAIPQGEEFIFIEQDGSIEKIRFHDYDKIYGVRGLYEHLFCERYKCKSPEVVCGLLEKQLKHEGVDHGELAVLDVGAGNGMVGEELSGLGVKPIVGIDIIEEAKVAVMRDRPDIYNEYHVADLTDLPSAEKSSLANYSFNCMTVVAALGFGDIPPAAFAGGFNMIAPEGWIAFNIKEDFMAEGDKSGFANLIDRLASDGILDIQERHRYRHRFCQDGNPLYYYAVIGKKMGEIENDMLAE